MAAKDPSRTMTTAQRGTTALVGGPRTYASRDEMVAAAVAGAPNRPASSVRRGVLHNSKPAPGGGYTWRYDQLDGPGDFSPLWEHVSAARIPFTLVRGGESAFVGDEDAAELLRRSPSASVHVVPGAGHSVQSDRPRELVTIIDGVLAGAATATGR